MSQALAVPRTGPGESLILPGVTWSEYSRLLRAFGERPGMRLTYDQGELEIMSPSYEHDSLGRFLGDMVRFLAIELGLPINRGGSTTIRKKSEQRGIEPDDCFWIASIDGLQLGRSLDLGVSPPPDLAIEVDVSRSSMNRLEIYAKLGVAEIWRLEKGSLTFLVLGEQCQYLESPTSRSFPFVHPSDLLPFLHRALVEKDQGPIFKDFVAWAKTRKGPGESGCHPKIG